jgi:uncharacterized protein (TIGR03546 family)
MIAKKIAKILRGNATPAQLMIACVLGSALGFMPGFAQAPGLIVLLTLLLIVLNGNLAVAAMVAVVAKIVSLLIMPLSFGVGRVLLDGPAQGLFKAAVNAPVLALFGLEYYTTTGGLLVGLALGTVAGLVVISLVRKTRTTMASLEEGSEGYRQWMAKWWVRLLLSVFVGRGAKESYTSLLERRGKAIRPVGVVFCVLVIILLVVVQMFFAGPVVASALQRGLERVNGATVDLEAADVDLAQGRMTLTGLAMADQSALDFDVFRAAAIEADVSAASLLRKRLKLDRVEIRDAEHGARRATPGWLVGDRPTPVKPVEPKPGEKTLDDYVRDARQWQQRLVQVRRWIDRLSGPTEEREVKEAEQPAGESLRERLEREIQVLGYAHVAAGHLIEGAPTFAVGELVAEGIRTDAIPNETVNVRGANLSTHPHLVQEIPSVTIESSGDTLRLALGLGAASAARGASTVDFAYRGLPVDRIADDLSVGGSPPIAGGTMDVALQGSVRTTGGTYIELPLQVTLHNTTLTVGGQSAPIEQLMIPLGLRGPIENPRIRLDDSQLADALVAAGAGVLANELRGRADEQIKKALSDVDLEKGLPGIDLEKGLGLSGGKEADRKEEQDDQKQKQDELRQKAKNLTEGLFGGKKKDKEDEE